jgi:hypothetical protein
MSGSCRIVQHGCEYRLQLASRCADYLKNLGGRGFPLQRLIALAAKACDFCFKVGGRTGTAHVFRRGSALYRLAASRFSHFAACSGAPSHRPSQGRTTPIFKVGLQQGFANCEIGLGVSLHGSNLKTLMAAMGQKQTPDERPLMSALPPKADIAGRNWDVRFVPKADICSAASSSYSIT